MYRVAVAYLVAAFVVVQVADLAAGAFGLPSWFEPLAWVLCGLGLPVALVLAWAYDIGPDGVQRASALGDSSEAAGSTATGEGDGPTGRSVLVVAAAILVIAGAWYLIERSGPEVTDRSIAVLPFESAGGAESAQFGAGLYDGLLTRLTNVTDLTVKSRTSAGTYRGTDATIPEIAGELGVAWIVEGSVYQAGDQMRVNATLIDARADERRWADDYDLEFTVENVFAIQSDIARSIAGSLQAELSDREEERLARRPTDDLDAYRLYVEGRIELGRRTETGMRRAAELFQRAIERDSAYALAWSGLADVYQIQATFGFGPPDSLRRSGLEAARRAVELDPDLAEARVSLGLLIDTHLRDLPAAIRELERAIELKPSYAQAHQWLGQLEGSRGRRETALRHVRRAAELDPRSPVIQLVLGWTYWWVEGPDTNALQHVRMARDLEPSLAVAHVDEGLILSDAGRQEEAIAALERGLELSADGSLAEGIAVAGLGIAYALSGDVARAREMLSRLAASEHSPLFPALVHAALGENDEAFAALERVVWTSLLRWDLLIFPAFDPLRNDPRYAELVRNNNVRWGLAPDGSLPDA